jgi:hypothetical protein
MSDSLSEKNIDDEFFTALRWHCSSVFFSQKHDRKHQWRATFRIINKAEFYCVLAFNAAPPFEYCGGGVINSI